MRLESILEPRWRPRAPRGASRDAKMAIWGVNMKPRWSQDCPGAREDGAKTGQEATKMTPLGSFLAYFWKSWDRSLPRRPLYKIEHPYNVFGDFFGPGGHPVGGSSGPSWAILASSWAILGDLAFQFALSWSIFGEFGFRLRPSWFVVLFHWQAQNGGIASGWTTGRTIEFLEGLSYLNLLKTQLSYQLSNPSLKFEISGIYT